MSPLPKYPTRAVIAEQERAESWWRTVKIPFGKHVGLTMWQLVKSYPEYLKYLDQSGFEGWGKAGMAIHCAIRHVKEDTGERP